MFQTTQTMTLAEFCRDHKLCRATLYKLWRKGIGPRVIKVGRKNLITLESAEAWRREREQLMPMAEAVR